MFCFGCPLASRAPLVRIQDIAMAKNLTMRGLQDEQEFLDNFERNLVKFGITSLVQPYQTSSCSNCYGYGPEGT